jgi:Phytanoyl-CoA dioxygenase (PhyH)
MVGELHRFWAQQMAGTRGDWPADNTLLAGLRVGLRETYDYLLNKQPTFAEFEQWVIAKNGGAICAERLERLRTALAGDGQPANPDAEPALSAADLEFWDRQGYVILRDAVPPENCQSAVQAICDFLDVRLDRPDTWYTGPQGHSIWIPLLHHPALWANRDSARIHRAFAQLWDREDIWVNVDQAGFNPPEKPGWKFPGPHLHWDVSLAKPIPFGVQGILYLADVAADQGAFTCVPGFHRKIDSWLKSLPEGSDPRAQVLIDVAADAVPISGRAGDLVIWNQALPHGSSPNRAALPRIVQYLVCRPSRWGYNPVWR